MPTIYKYFGFIFVIFTRGEEGHVIHIHAKKDGRKSAIEIIYDEKEQKVIAVKARKPKAGANISKELSEKDLNTAVKFVNVKAEEIVRAWYEVLANKYKQKPIVITRKIV